MIPTAHRAKFIFAEPGLILQNAIIYVSGSGRISQIERWNSSPAKVDPKIKVVDWGSAIIMPGLINAHAHLELTSFNNQLTEFGSFTDWLSQLINRRRNWTQEDFLTSAGEGARLSLASGTTLVGDITASGIGWKATNRINLRRVVFEEVLALSPDQADQIMERLTPILSQTDPNSLLVHGISPHAPYSVSPQLYMRATEQARHQDITLATHLAETPSELRFLHDGTGEFRDFLIERGVLPLEWKPPGLSPVSYLSNLGVLGPSCLLVHCNYLDDASINIIRETRSNVVYCPRSHAFFDHKDHPIRELLDHGINVALGTDSLASNSSLSIVDEMRFLFQKRKDLNPEEIFKAATVNGAIALNFPGVVGRLEQGYWADMTVLELPHITESRRLLDQILEGCGDCIATIVQGQLAWHKSGLSELNFSGTAPAGKADDLRVS
jgi:aminodeoxyfutalosine deaminase